MFDAYEQVPEKAAQKSVLPFVVADFITCTSNVVACVEPRPCRLPLHQCGPAFRERGTHRVERAVDLVVDDLLLQPRGLHATASAGTRVARVRRWPRAA